MKLCRSLFLILATFSLTGCVNIDCPLDNIVVMTSAFYVPESADNNWTETPVLLQDTLTVTAEGTTETLLNKAYNIKSFALPLRSASQNDGIVEDTLKLRFANALGGQTEELLKVTHTSYVHFEAIDCPSSVFHTIKEAELLTHNVLDSVKVTRSIVNYDDVENIRLYVRTSE